MGMVDEPVSEAKRGRGGWTRWLVWGGLVVPPACLLLLVGGSLWQIEDWDRDLSTNWSATDPLHKDPALHPLATMVSPAEVAEAVRLVVPQLRGWRVVSIATEPSDRTTGENRFSVQPVQLVHLVRTSRLFGFEDDVKLTIGRKDGRTSVEATSRSRVGVGDLGQNPRNLREILGALDSHLLKASAGHQRP
jgi:hypothetical protein